jgi:Rhodopirellula transposase DDE domain
MGYSLQVNLKTIEGTKHPDRDQQFRYLNDQVRRFVRTRDRSSASTRIMIPPGLWIALRGPIRVHNVPIEGQPHI